jgi:hypothetical protein
MIDEEFGGASITMHTSDVCSIFVALYPVTSVTLRGVEFGLDLVSFHIYARAWVQARNFLEDCCVLWAWTSFQHTAMIPPCAFANWLHGLHGEAFEEVVFFLPPLLPRLLAIVTVSCFYQVGHQGKQIDWVDIVELFQLVLATSEDFLLCNDGIVTRLHTFFHAWAHPTDSTLSKTYCYDGSALSLISSFAHPSCPFTTALRGSQHTRSWTVLCHYIYTWIRHAFTRTSVFALCCNGLSLLGLVI